MCIQSHNMSDAASLKPLVLRLLPLPITAKGKKQPLLPTAPATHVLVHHATETHCRLQYKGMKIEGCLFQSYTTSTMVIYLFFSEKWVYLEITKMGKSYSKNKSSHVHLGI